MEVLNPSLSANTNHYSWVPMFQTFICPNSCTVMIPNHSLLGELLGIQPSRTSIGHCRPSRIDVGNGPRTSCCLSSSMSNMTVGMSNMLHRSKCYSTIGKNTSNMLAFKVLAIASCSARICLTILPKEMATLLWTLEATAPDVEKCLIDPERNAMLSHALLCLHLHGISVPFCTFVMTIMMHHHSFALG